MKKFLFTCIAFALAWAMPPASPTAEGGVIGSFENPPNGQDDPIEAVIAAIEEATGTNPVGLTHLFKSDYNEGSAPTTSGIAASYFEASFTGPKQEGSITQSNDPISVSGTTYTPSYYTAKVDGPNGGFIVYSWGGSPASFDNNFYKFVDDDGNGRDDTTGKAPTFYTHINKAGDSETNNWATSETGTLTDFGVSHVSVFGVSNNDGPTPGPGTVPEPASVLVWTLGLIGCGTVARRRRKAVTG